MELFTFVPVFIGVVFVLVIGSIVFAATNKDWYLDVE